MIARRTADVAVFLSLYAAGFDQQASTKFTRYGHAVVVTIRGGHWKISIHEMSEMQFETSSPERPRHEGSLGSLEIGGDLPSLLFLRKAILSGTPLARHVTRQG